MTYFGNTNETGVSDDTGNINVTYTNEIVGIGTPNIRFQCPGTGPKTLVELSAYVKLPSGSGNLLMAIYDESSPYSIVAQGSAVRSVSGTGYSWQGHTSFTGSTVLTGGNYYILCVWFSSNDIVIGYHTVTSGYINAKTGTDYSGGFPGTVLDPNGAVAVGALMRAGVQ